MPSAIEVEAFEHTTSPGKPHDAFHRLMHDLSDVLGPSSGLDSAEVDPQDLKHLMEKYVSIRSEWKQYAFGDPSRTFTRNLVDRGNGKSNLVSTALNRVNVITG